MKTCKDAAKEKRPLPVGVSDYVRAQAEYYYVDKTLLIKEFLDRKPLVSLFTRPRRFGKTLNMDMLRVFFEISDEDISILKRRLSGSVDRSIPDNREITAVYKNEILAHLLQIGAIWERNGAQ